jgi:hypothetical protein
VLRVRAGNRTIRAVSLGDKRPELLGGRHRDHGCSNDMRCACR